MNNLKSTLNGAASDIVFSGKSGLGNAINVKQLRQEDIDPATGIVMDAVVFKNYPHSWDSNPMQSVIECCTFFVIPHPWATDKSKKCRMIFTNFNSREDASAAIAAMNGRFYNGCLLHVAPKTDRDTVERIKRFGKQVPIANAGNPIFPTPHVPVTHSGNPISQLHYGPIANTGNTIYQLVYVPYATAGQLLSVSPPETTFTPSPEQTTPLTDYSEIVSNQETPVNDLGGPSNGTKFQEGFNSIAEMVEFYRNKTEYKHIRKISPKESRLRYPLLKDYVNEEGMESFRKTTFQWTASTEYWPYIFYKKIDRKFVWVGAGKDTLGPVEDEEQVVAPESNEMAVLPSPPSRAELTFTGEYYIEDVELLGEETSWLARNCPLF